MSRVCAIEGSGAYVNPPGINAGGVERNVAEVQASATQTLNRPLP